MDFNESLVTLMIHAESTSETRWAVRGRSLGLTVQPSSTRQSDWSLAEGLEHGLACGGWHCCVLGQSAGPLPVLRGCNPEHVSITPSRLLTGLSRGF